MKYCPECNKEFTSDDAQFCNICGSALIDNNANKKDAVCPSCGKQVPYEQQYCSQCGTNLKSEGKSETIKANHSSNKQPLIIVIIVAVVAVIGAMGIKIYNTYFENKSDSTNGALMPKTSYTYGAQTNNTLKNNQNNNINTEGVLTTKTEITTVSENQGHDIPAELQKYASDLVYEGRTYRISLQEDDWYINYRSEPIYMALGASNSNVIGKLKSGTEIYVEYIYDEVWAVYKENGVYVFSSLYGSNDPTQNKLMEPRDD